MLLIQDTNLKRKMFDCFYNLTNQGTAFKVEVWEIQNKVKGAYDIASPLPGIIFLPKINF